MIEIICWLLNHKWEITQSEFDSDVYFKECLRCKKRKKMDLK